MHPRQSSAHLHGTFSLGGIDPDTNPDSGEPALHGVPTIATELGLLKRHPPMLGEPLGQFGAQADRHVVK
jgi:hypothetical protein